VNAALQMMDFQTGIVGRIEDPDPLLEKIFFPRQAAVVSLAEWSSRSG
jgi:hypothetical protein